MTANEIIKALQNVAPNTEVTISTDYGTRPIDRIITTGYASGTATIITAD